jgi:hypothetical protein
MTGLRNQRRVIANSASRAIGRDHRSQALPAQCVVVELSRDDVVDAPADRKGHAGLRIGKPPPFAASPPQR